MGWPRGLSWTGNCDWSGAPYSSITRALGRLGWAAVALDPIETVDPCWPVIVHMHVSRRRTLSIHAPTPALLQPHPHPGCPHRHWHRHTHCAKCLPRADRYTPRRPLCSLIHILDARTGDVVERIEAAHDGEVRWGTWHKGILSSPPAWQTAHAGGVQRNEVARDGEASSGQGAGARCMKARQRACS